MSNQYFDFRTSSLPPFVPGSKVRAGEVNILFDAVEAAFDLLPTDPESMELGTATLGTESGSGNAYVVAMPKTRTANANGDEVVFRATHSNTGAATLQVDAISAVALRRFNGDPVETGDIVTGRFYAARYDSANSRFVIVWPAQVTTVSGSIAYAPPSNSVSLAASAEGSASTVLRSDVQLTLSQAIAPTWTGAHTFTALGTAITAPSILVSNARPGISINETDGAANNRLWGVEAQSEQLRLFAATDAGTATNFLTVDRTDGTIDSIAFTATAATFSGTLAVAGSVSVRDATNLFDTGTVPAARLPSSFSGLANPTASIGLSAVNGSATTAMRSDGAPALSQSITPTWSAVHTFGLSGTLANPSVIIASSQPILELRETDAAANNQKWAFAVSSEQFQCRVVNDSGGAATTWFAVDRTTTTVDSIALTATNVTVNGTEVLRTGNAFANPTGTIGLTAVNGSAVTALRSDGAPALSQSIAPTWTGKHVFTNQYTTTGNPAIQINANTPGIEFFDANGAVNNRYWSMYVGTEQLIFDIATDAGAVANWLVVDRTNGTVERVTFPSEVIGALVVGTYEGSAVNSARFVARTTSSSVTAAMLVNQSAAQTTLWVHNQATSGDNVLVTFATESGGLGSERGSITYNRGGGVIAYNTTCRERFKRNILPSDPALPLLSQLPIVKFDWADSTAKLPYFVTYERLENLVPWACQNDGVDVSKLVPLTIKALQELAERVAALESPASTGVKVR